ncbi:lysophospholipase L1-like esterase [Kineosphaera limosa]|uniref:GDSL-type esterase/lipase family protein n=1 Tax=Kineosphaera limosa TaxID=111564 RepID=UPI00068E619F|nr:GDSL-type esterase/lipase family protein [Kineosphaera limosa]NYE00348.1 lysophospholipase L1-like esterase [Kineosphaera limosa]
MALTVPLAAGAKADPGEWFLLPGQTLGPDQSLRAPNGSSTLRMQQDGNLVQYAASGAVLWASHTVADANRNSILRMQDDGNAVVIAPGNRPVWATGTSGNSGSTLELQNDGNLVVYAPGHRAIWANGVQLDAPSKPANPAPSQSFFVAMGDSFSSGEGNPPFDEGTANSRNSCHRSSQAWPRLLAEKVGVPIHPSGHMACSGAVTNNILKNRQFNEVTQLEHLRRLPGAKFITVTIGGNDAAFATTVTVCTLSDFRACFAAVERSKKLIRDKLPGRLAQTYDGIRRNSQGQKIVVVGYPSLMTKSDFNLPKHCVWLDPVSRQLLVNLASDLENGLSRSVRDAQARGLNIEYVSTLDSFAGHELCTADSYVKSITPASANNSYAAHPILKGQEAMANRVAESIRGLGLAS